MESKLIFVILAFAFNFQYSQAAVGGDLLSTLRIVGKLCIPGNHNDDVAQKFFACYDQAPGKQQFVDCQIKAFGAPMNSRTNITNACLKSCKLSTYADCLKTSFQAAGIDQTAAVTKVNQCQAQVLGVK